MREKAPDAEAEGAVQVHDLHTEAIPGQMDLTDFMDMGQDEPGLPVDDIIAKMGLENSDVLKDILEVSNDKSLDDETKDIIVGKLLEGITDQDEKQKIIDALNQMPECA
ncbi:MAG: hypothetical protein NC489_40150 [Ruminococcus flavefaciens]|nr:hypothetical protein [Ruminococcus flavefaciens]